MAFLAVGVERVLDDLWVPAAAHSRYDVGAFALCMEMIAVAELEEAQVAVLVADVARYGLKSPEQQCLPKRVEVLAEWIDELDEVL